MNKIYILSIILMALLVQSVLADFYYTPMNFEPGNPVNHSFEINLTGFINVTIPSGFVLMSGNLTGNSSLAFIIKGTNVSNTSELYIGQIYLNDTLYSNYYLLAIEDNKIVDTKVEIGHGDFNYIDYNADIGTDESLLFTLVRVWGIGSDIWNEPATDIRFNCTFPDYLPRTVDRKYTTTYNTNNILAEGSLLRLEGISLFRIFVLSQEVQQFTGTNYEVTCSDLEYDFTNTKIVASIPGVNLSVRSLEPLIISMDNSTGYVVYTVKNNESYDLRNLEFLWTIGTETVRNEKGNLDSGETVIYQVEVNDSGSISLKTRFVPEWMFNSRSPTYYDQTTFDIYQAGDAFSQLDSSEYYNNQSIETPIILETTVMHFKLNTLKESLCPEDNLYRVTYTFYDDEGAGPLVETIENEITAVNNHDIYFASTNLNPTDVTKTYAVYTVVSMKDDSCSWQSFDRELIGNIEVTPFTTRTSTIGPYDVIVNTVYDKYESGEKVTALITLKNTGDEPDTDAILIYYLEDSSGKKFGETKEQLLEIEIGTTILTRSVTLPLSSSPGEWSFSVEYLTTAQPVIEVYSPFEEITGYSIWSKANDRTPTYVMNNYIFSFIIMTIFIMLLIFLVIYLNKKISKNK